MKKNYLCLILLFWSALLQAQTLNQSAGWPNTSWSVTGNYNTSAAAFESSPLTTSSFAFNDDAAGFNHDDQIAAESPVINLTAAHTAGENRIEVTVDYGYYFLNEDVLRLEYWNADASVWVPWTENLPGNNTTVTFNFCSIPKTNYTSVPLMITNFTATQLAGFRYRIYYNDDLNGIGYNYGFCFNSPRIYSVGCPTPAGLVVTNSTATTAQFSWNAIPDITQFEGYLTTTPGAVNPSVQGIVINGNSYTASGLLPATTYYFHLRTTCANGGSLWRMVSFTTAPAPPVNDDCGNAVTLTVNPNLNCATTTAGTTLGATQSMAAGVCSGTPDDDVWYRFTAQSVTQQLVIANVVTVSGPTDVNMYFQVFSGSCGALESVLCSDAETNMITGLTIGTAYWVRVYSVSNTSRQNFTICIGTPILIPVNDECATAAALTVGTQFSDHNLDATTVGATASSAAISCVGYNGGDVWFTTVVPASGSLTIETGDASTGGQGLDTAIAVYAGSCTALSQIGCDDDGAGTGGYSKINLTGLTPDTSIYIRVYEKGNDASGTFSISAYDATLGTGDFDAIRFKAYPNPVKETLFVDWNENMKEATIYNLLGQQVLSKAIEGTSARLDLSSLPQGTYLVRIKGAEAVRNFKILKK
ncbi:T9SS type A sorting domain-containing protein [Flavobacterium kingsejongi]|uniref:Fibronectin type-III domain-containing protein n=1 Tax=Flavobacterium kingsejongi TaxID=1678728 RepID=A0A2S1LSI3_9FLAO|nr:T9SS type A sorting domain-containing protein [Flavobacterium kingsejongi]AWG26596.1 hypothetical protein FK004_15875 [Flavobacterium kingsejongi]